MRTRRKSLVVARMTITTTGSNKKLIVEVHEDASFSQFYKWFSQDGRKRKRFMRMSHRGDGIRPVYLQAHEAPGLEKIGDLQRETRPNIESIVIKVFKKHLYKQLLQCPPDQLGKGLPKIRPWDEVWKGTPEWQKPKKKHYIIHEPINVYAGVS